MRDISLLIHSTGMGPSMWARVPPAVVGRTTKLTPTNLGYAPLPAIPRGTACSIEREVLHLLSHVGSGQGGVHLYGHSYGAVAALRLAKRLGSRTRSLFLFEPPLFGALGHDTSNAPEALEEVRTFEAMPWFLHDEERGGRDEWLEVFIDYWNRPGSWGRMGEPMKSEMQALGWKMFQEVRACFLEVVREDDRDLPPHVPCTIVRGERSPKAAQAMMQALARRNPHAVAHTLSGVGHMSFLIKPKELYEVMLAHAKRAGVAHAIDTETSSVGA